MPQGHAAAIGAHAPVAADFFLKFEGVLFVCGFLFLFRSRVMHAVTGNVGKKLGELGLLNYENRSNWETGRCGLCEVEVHVIIVRFAFGLRFSVIRPSNVEQQRIKGVVVICFQIKI